MTFFWYAIGAELAVRDNRLPLHYSLEQPFITVVAIVPNWKLSSLWKLGESVKPKSIAQGRCFRLHRL